MGEFCDRGKLLKLWGNYTILSGGWQGAIGGQAKGAATAAEAAAAEQAAKMATCDSGKIETLLEEAARRLIAETTVGTKQEIDVGIGPNFCDGDFISIPLFLGGVDTAAALFELQAKVTPEALFKIILSQQAKVQNPVDLRISPTHGVTAQVIQYSDDMISLAAKSLQSPNATDPATGQTQQAAAAPPGPINPPVPVPAYYQKWHTPLSAGCSGGCSTARSMPTLPISAWAVAGKAGSVTERTGSIAGTWFISKCHQYTDVVCGEEEKFAAHLRGLLNQFFSCKLGYEMQIEAGAGGTYNKDATAEMKTGGCAAKAGVQRFVDVRLTRFKGTDEAEIMAILKNRRFKMQLSEAVFGLGGCVGSGCMMAGGNFGPDGRCHQSDFFWAPNGGEPHAEKWEGGGV
eukprot:g10619.t1